MAVYDLFKDAWDKKFSGEPLPTNLAFLEGSENLQSLGAAVDSAQRMIAKLDKERNKQKFILDFVVERIDTVIAASRVRYSSGCLDEGEDVYDHAPLSSRASYSEAASPPNRTSSRTSYGQPVRAQGAAAQFAAVMASAKNKLGFGWSNATRNSGGGVGANSGQTGRDTHGAMHYFGKKPNLASKFYDGEKSNMVRTCSAPSLIDDSAEYKSRSPKGTASNRSVKISAALTVVPQAIQRTNNLTQSVAVGDNVFVEQPNGNNVGTAELLLETDIDEVAPPLPPPPVNRGSKPQLDDRTSKSTTASKFSETGAMEISNSPPAVDRSSRLQTAEDMMRLRASKVRPTRHHVYEEPLDDHAPKDSADSGEDEADTEDVHASSDEEPLYLNMLLLKKQKDQQQFMNDSAPVPLVFEQPDGANDRKNSTSEAILANTLSIASSVVQVRARSQTTVRRSEAMAIESDLDDLDVMVPINVEDEKRHVWELGVKSFQDSEKRYLENLQNCLQLVKDVQNRITCVQQSLPKDDVVAISLLLTHVTQLHQIHQQFISQVDGVNCDPVKIATAFHMLAKEENKVASYYAKNYPNIVHAIHHCSQLSTPKDLWPNKEKQIENLQELGHEPIERFNKLKLTLQDLIKSTSISSSEYDALQTALSIVLNYLNPPKGVDYDGLDKGQYLISHGLVVEKSGPVRKLRQVFLFKNIFVCARQRVSSSAREQDQMSFEVKWFIPVSELSLGETSATSADDKQAADNRMPEIIALHQKVSNACNDVRVEMKRAKQAAEAQRQSSFKMHTKNAERFRKKLIEQKIALMKAAPNLPLQLIHRKINKTYVLLTASDYERATWRSYIAGLIGKCYDSPSFELPAVQKLLDSLKLPQLSTLGALLGTDNFSLEEESVFGSLCITIVGLQGLTSPADVYCCIEVDSFGHFLLKAKTHVAVSTAEPLWNSDFEIDLDGAQMLRFLCYQKQNDCVSVISKGAIELTKEKLSRDHREEVISLDNQMSLVVAMSYQSRQQTLKRTLSLAKEGLFGVRIRAVTRREGTKIPLIVTSCVEEIESRGMKDVGIYRISGLSSEINRVKKAFEKNSRSAVGMLKGADTSVITGLLKLYLRELPEALFTDGLYPSLVEGMGLLDPETREKNMLRLIQSLPEPNYSTVLYLFDHLIRVSEQESVNKMTIQNLATVFGPTLLRPADKDPDKVSVEELLSAGARDAMMQIAILCYLLNLKQRKHFGVRL